MRITRSGSGWPRVYRCSARAGFQDLRQIVQGRPAPGMFGEQGAHRVDHLAPPAITHSDVDGHAPSTSRVAASASFEGGRGLHRQ